MSDQNLPGFAGAPQAPSLVTTAVTSLVRHGFTLVAGAFVTATGAVVAPLQMTKIEDGAVAAALVLTAYVWSLVEKRLARKA